jgi:hypothetical protein
LYILPAIAAILKTRKRKLESVANADVSSLKNSSSIVNDLLTHLVSSIDVLLTFKTKSAENEKASDLQLISMKSVASRKFCFGLLNDVKMSAFFSKVHN